MWYRFKKQDPANFPSILTANLLYNWVYNCMEYLRQLIIRQDLSLSRLYLWKEPDNGLIVGPKPVASRAFIAIEFLCKRLKIKNRTSGEVIGETCGDD